MTSDADKLPTGTDPGNDADGWTIGGRADRESIRLIDIAAAIEGKKRGPWMIDACLDRARRVIAAHRRAA